MSQKGKMKMKYNGFTFHKNMSRGDVTYWRCNEKAKTKCMANIVQYSNNRLKFSENFGHNHPKN